MFSPVTGGTRGFVHYGASPLQGLVAEANTVYRLDYGSGHAVWQLGRKFGDNPQFIPDIPVVQSMHKAARIAAGLCIVQLRQFLPIVALGELSRTHDADRISN